MSDLVIGGYVVTRAERARSRSRDERPLSERAGSAREGASWIAAEGITPEDMRTKYEYGRQTGRVQIIKDTCGGRVALRARGVRYGLIALAMRAEKTLDSSPPGQQRGHSGTCSSL